MTNKRPAAIDHTHEPSTQTYDGFQSKDDKKLLDEVRLAKPGYDAMSSDGITRSDILITDFDTLDPTTLTQGKIYSVNTGFQPLNRPTSENFFSGFLMVHNIGGNLATLFLQSTGYGMYMRYFNGTNWSVFYRIWTQNTDGASSGLDADTLDGNQGTYYQQALVSGTNIKTINGSSVLGSGDLSVVATIPSTLSTDRLRATATDDVGLASTLHGFQIGDTAGVNMAMDNNEIMVRNNGAAATLYLNADGSLVSIAQNLSYGSTTNPTVYGNPIVEKGGSGDYQYTKYYDGTMIVYAKAVTSAIACNTAMTGGGGFKTATQTLTISPAFTNSDYFGVVSPGSSSMVNIGGGGYVSSVSAFAWYLTSVSSDATTRVRTGSIHLVGRWY